MVSPVISEEIKLSLDFEFGESGDVIFNRLSDLATDSNNNIYLLDHNEKLIYVFNETGKYLKKIGRPGQGPGEFQYLDSIFIDHQDILYILDSRNRRVEIFDSEANYGRSIALKGFPGGYGSQIIADKNGNLYISGHYRKSNSVLAKYSSTGELLKHFPLPLVEYNVSSFNDFNQQMVNQNINGGTMCFDEGDNLIFSYGWPYKIVGFTSEGEGTIQFSINNNLNWIPIKFEVEPDGLFNMLSTRTHKIFLFENKYLVNSIYSVDWEGNPKKKISPKDIPENLDKYITIKRSFAVLDFYTQNGQLIGTAEIDERIYFLASDNKGRILGIKHDEEGIQTIVKYKAEIINN